MTERDITLTTERRIGWFWNRQTVKTTQTYRGHSTVWRDVETGRRANTYTEAILSDMEWKLEQDDHR